MGETWRDDFDDDGDEFPSPEAKTAPRLALPRKNRGGGGSATENWSIDFCFRVSASGVKIPAEGGLGEVPLDQAPWWRGQGGGRATWPPGPGVAPLRPIFWLLGSSGAWIFLGFFLDFYDMFKFPFSCTQKKTYRQLC